MEQDSFAIATSWVKQSHFGQHKKFPRILPDVDNKVLANFARDFRKKHRIKSKEVAEKMNINTASISLLEKGQLQWNEELLIAYIDTIIFLTKEFYSANFN